MNNTENVSNFIKSFKALTEEEKTLLATILNNVIDVLRNKKTEVFQQEKLVIPLNNVIDILRNESLQQEELVIPFRRPHEDL